MRALAVALLLLAGCTHAPSAPQRAGPTAGDYYPLEVGHSWTYDANRLGAKEQFDVKVLRLGERGFVVSTGQELLVDSYGVRDQQRYLLRNPIEVGTKWSSVVSVQAVEHYEIIAADQPCEVPAGSFTGCVTVQSTQRAGADRTLVNEMTFAPGVGLVRLSVVLDNKGQVIPQHSYTLTKYALARAGAQKP